MGQLTPPSWSEFGSGLDPYQGVWSDKEAIHLARRTLFGVRKEDLAKLITLNAEKAVKELLKQEPVPPVPVNDYNRDDLIDPDVPFGKPWVDAARAENGDVTSARIVSLKSWWINQILEQKLSLHQKMILFWHNHFATQSWGVFWPTLSYQHFMLLHQNAFGNFKTLTKLITLDPQMLLYLNGAFNNKDAPDENYARELQELFCIGKGPLARYTESDVQQAARVLTGWTIDWNNKGVSYFNPWLHDRGTKNFSSFYNNKIINGKAGVEGAQELDELLNMIFDHTETALFISRKLYRFFVYSEITAEAETLVIEPMARLLRENNYEIKPVLQALFSSAHFYHPDIRGAQIKSPTDFLLGFWRSTKVSMPFQASVRQQLQIRSSLLWHMDGIGQQLLDPPNVAGWPAYYQVPNFDRSWITTDSIPRRAIMTDSFIYWGFWSEDLLTNVDLPAYVKTLREPAYLDPLIDELSDVHLGGNLSATVRNTLKSILLTGQSNEFYWTHAWNSFVAAPNDRMARTTVESRLKPFFQYFMQLSEYQLY